MARLEQMASERKTTPARIAMARLLARGDKVVPIFGTRKIERIDENLAALQLSLSSEDCATLDAWFAPDKVAGARYPEAGMKGINR